MIDLLDNPLLLLMLAPGLLFSLVIHEYAHARTALAFGDPTARDMGRITLNPLRHLDPIGTLMIFVIGFGWARPVPVNPANLHPPGKGDIAVSLAGPLSNLAFAMLLAVVVRILIAADALGAHSLVEEVVKVMLFTMRVNICLFMFNLLPLFPLDGHHILREILPARRRYNYMAWQIRYGMIVLVAVMIAPGWIPQLPDVFGMVFNQVAPRMVDWALGA